MSVQYRSAAVSGVDVAYREAGDPAGPEACLRDVPDAEPHLLDTGHFAREDHGEEIAGLIRAFHTTRVTRPVTTRPERPLEDVRDE